MSSHVDVDWLQPVNWNSPLNRGLVSWWMAGDGPFWGGPKFLDLCGKNHGTLTNGAAWGGPLGCGHGSVVGDGTNDVVNCGTDSSLVIAGSITVGGLFYLTVLADANAAFAAKGYDGSNEGYVLRLSTGNRLCFFSFDGGLHGVSNGRTFTSGDLNKWFHVAGTFDGATWKTFYNGALDSSAADAVGPRSTTSPFSILGEDISGSFQRCITGRGNDVRLYNRALSDAEITSWFQASLTGYQQELNYIRRQYIFDVGAGGGGGAVVPALDQGMLTGGLSTLCGGLA